MLQKRCGIAVAVTVSEMEIQITRRERRAFTMVELLIVIAALVLVAAMLLPALAAAKRKSSRIGCVNNLKQDDLAFKMWANDNDGKYPMQVSVTDGGAMEFAEMRIAFPIFQSMSNELNAPKILVCPNDTFHFAATNFTTDFNNGKISYFVGLNATESNPPSILLGDDNLIVNGKPVSSGILNFSSKDVVEWSAERHHYAGNITLADGSAWEADDKLLAEKLIETGMATNRLVIP